MAGPQYFGSIPGIQQAYQNDPRTRLAAQALAAGTSTAPVAQGGWGATEGFARAAQAILGAVVQKGQDKKYAAREAAYGGQMAQAAQLATQPAPQPAMGAAAQALGGQPAPMQTVDPNIGLPAPISAPPAQAMAPMAPQAPTGRSAPPQGFTPRPGEGGTSPANGALAVTFGGGSLPDNIQTVGDLVANKRQLVRKLGASPVGVFQINAGTWAEFAPKVLGKDWRNAPIRDMATQDAVARAIYESTGSDPNKLAGRWASLDLKEAQQLAGRPWEEVRDKIAQGESGGAAGGVAGAPQVPQSPPVAQPTMEAVPNLPQAPTQAPAAPQRPGEVQSTRLPIAQQLMATGNPDLMAYAQEMLGKGLDEQNAGRTLASQQEFAQGQTGYQSGLNDFNDARSQVRGGQINDRRDASQRNFGREQTYTDQTFRAGQGDIQRQYDTGAREDQQQFAAGESAASRAFQAQQDERQRQFAATENQANRDNKLSVASQKGARDAQRSNYFTSAAGRAMQEKHDIEIQSNAKGIGQLERFIDLNSKKGTGGVAYNTPVIGSLYGAFDSDIKEMRSIADDVTLAGLGGSLGPAISDGDRKFISGANISVEAPRQANENIARAKIGAFKRKNDYLTEFANAQADGTQAQFAKNWALFASNTPIVKYDSKGNAVAGVNDKPTTYQEWLASRPSFDKNGKKVR